MCIERFGAAGSSNCTKSNYICLFRTSSCSCSALGLNMEMELSKQSIVPITRVGIRGANGLDVTFIISISSLPILDMDMDAYRANKENSSPHLPKSDTNWM